MRSPASCTGPITSSSHTCRAARARGSVRSTNWIIGSSEAATAVMPPSQSWRRTSGSARREPATRRSAMPSGLSLPSSMITAGEPAPSSSRVLESQNSSSSFSSTGCTGLGSNRFFSSRARRSRRTPAVAGGRLDPLGGGADEVAGVAVEVGAAAGARLQLVPDHELQGVGLLRLVDLGPGIADLGGELGVGGELRLQVRLVLLARGDEGRVAQSRLAPGEDLVGVLVVEQGVLDQPAHGGALFAQLDQPSAQLGLLHRQQRQGDVAQGLHLGHGQLALGGAGAAGHEHRLARLRRGVGPGQIIRRRRRLAALVEAQEGAIEGEAREVEVVRIAAEEGRVELRREHQAHVGVLAELVNLELAALVEADHLAAVARVAAAGVLLGLGDRPFAGRRERLAGLAGAGGVDRRGDVGDPSQHLGLHARTGALLGRAAARKPSLT